MSSENCVETSSNNEEHNKCMLIMRQTDYDKETALLELKKYNGDVVAIIRNYMKNDDIEITVDCFIGNKNFTAYTMDLTKKYIDINADYRT